MSQIKIPEYSDVVAAAERISVVAVRTPLLQNPVLNDRSGSKVFIKPECLQRTGSFKFRGAYNTISQLSEEERNPGVVACSSGNHAQGVATVAAMFGCPATIVMPQDAPQTKIERTRRSGADVVLYDRATGDRDRIVADIIKKKGGVFVHPFENPNVIAGQGTVGLEIAEDLKASGLSADRVLVCTGGGGLTAGVALAINHHFPEANIHPVEPEGFDDYRRSLISGSIEENANMSGSVCDAIVVPSPGAIGFEINSSLLSNGIVVSDSDAMAAVRFAFEELKLVVEPGGAVALAAMLKAGQDWKDEVVAVVISGGNIDADTFEKALAS